MARDSKDEELRARIRGTVGGETIMNRKLGNALGHHRNASHLSTKCFFTQRQIDISSWSEHKQVEVLKVNVCFSRVKFSRVLLLRIVYNDADRVKWDPKNKC